MAHKLVGDGVADTPVGPAFTVITKLLLVIVAPAQLAVLFEYFMLSEYVPAVAIYVFSAPAARLATPGVAPVLTVPVAPDMAAPFKYHWKLAVFALPE